jgi:hypothetical protein
LMAGGLGYTSHLGKTAISVKGALWNITQHQIWALNPNQWILGLWLASSTALPIYTNDKKKFNASANISTSIQATSSIAYKSWTDSRGTFDSWFQVNPTVSWDMSAGIWAQYKSNDIKLKAFVWWTTQVIPKDLTTPISTLGTDYTAFAGWSVAFTDGPAINIYGSKWWQNTVQANFVAPVTKNIQIKGGAQYTSQTLYQSAHTTSTVWVEGTFITNKQTTIQPNIYVQQDNISWLTGWGWVKISF